MRRASTSTSEPVSAGSVPHEQKTSAQSEGAVGGAATPEVERDAMRYRWFRQWWFDDEKEAPPPGFTTAKTFADLDEAIDAALGAVGSPTQETK